MSSVQIVLILAILEVPFVAGCSTWFARRVRAGQIIRTEGPGAHSGKAGTPTMVGSMLLLGLLLGVLGAWAGGVPFGGRALFVLVAAGGGGLLGLADDLLSQRHRRSQGLAAPLLLVAQGVLALGLYGIAMWAPPAAFRIPFASLTVPAAELPVWAGLLLVFIAFPATVNAVNVTDGLDGLATGTMAISLVVLAVVTRADPELFGLTSLGLGACLGFLWVNAHPARGFLGNVGSMGLGGLLFGLAYVSGGIFLLPLIGGLFVVEMGSVILQVLSYKLCGKRLLRMSPLHHHLEVDTPPWPHVLRGARWHEATVVVRLWIVATVFAAIALLALLPGGM